MTDLFTIIDARHSHDKRYCSEIYWEWEDKIAKPALEVLGYERVTFHMGERDSFGPLSRKVRAYKEGVCHEFIYG
jgi:hypothetical protein